MPESVIQRSFAQGEVSPAIYTRADLAKYLQGLRTCRNFIIRREGGATYRPGFKFVAEIKDGSSDDVVLYRFETELAGEAYLIEAGLTYLRFYKDGAQIQVSGVAAYSGATAYVPGDLVSSAGVNYYCIAATTGNAPPNATFWYALTGTIYEVPAPSGFNLICEDSQNGNVLTLTRSDQQPLELIYSGETSWVLQTVATAPLIGPPTGVSVSPGVAGSRSVSYIVTAVSEDEFEESNPSAAGTSGAVDEPTEDNPHVVNWTAPTLGTPIEYYVYKDPYGNGEHGFIGKCPGTTFNDIGFVPDFNVTPPIAQTRFASAGEYPNVSTVYKQRRFFAAPANEPERIEASKVGFFSNFQITSPLQDDDALRFRLAGVHYHVIRWIRGLRQLIVGTDGGVWSVGNPNEALTPGSINAEQQTYAGVHDKPPVVIGNTLIYLEARGVRVRDLQFDQQFLGFAGRDLTTYATHLFDGYSLSRMDFQNVPHSTVWCVRGDGTLLGLTYIPEEDVFGWHRHDSPGGNGVFEHVRVIPEDVEDALYVVIKRTIDGTVTRYIERMEPFSVFDVTTDAFFLDSAISTTGGPAISGLDHLEGETVYALVDGAVQGPFTVASGAITLTAAGTTVIVGLAYVGDLETLALDVQGSAIRDRKKRIAGVTLLLENSSRVMSIGPNVSLLTPFEIQDYEDQSALFTGQAQLNPTSQFDLEARVFVRHDQPLPLTIAGIIPSVDMGG